MNILYHHRTMGRGAEGAHIAHIVNAFKELGHSVHVISPPGVDPLAEIGKIPLDKSDEKTTGITLVWKIISRYCPQIIFEFFELVYNFAIFFNLLKIIKKNKIEFIYERSAFFLFAGTAVAKYCNIPIIIEANEAVGIKRARKLYLSKIAKSIERYSFNRSHSIFTVSSHLAELISQNANSGVNIYVTPNAIDPTRFGEKTKRDEIRQRFGLTEKLVLGFAGWFDWWDRLDMLIDIQKELTEEGYGDVATMLIGHGVMAEDLENQIQNLHIQGNVILTGPVSKNEVLDYIDALDIGVLPHSNDFGSPMIMFEMMALGKCVIAPVLGPITDVVTDMENGVLFTPLDKSMLKSKIIAMVNETSIRNAIGNTARKLVHQKHTWNHIAENILQSLCSKPL